MKRSTNQFWQYAALLLVIVVAAQTAWIVYPHVRTLVVPSEISAAARGRGLAEELGCFACHGPLGQGGLANPGSAHGSVPAFHEGTIMMFAKNYDELREYILYGAPAARRTDPAYIESISSDAIGMPGYIDVLSASQVDDLVAYLRSRSDMLFPPEGSAAATGAELAYELGCRSCHGEMGSGGVANPGSLKGYIPGFYGSDYDELVRDDDELRAWIAKGVIPRFENDRLAMFFIERQHTQMPAYQDHVSNEQIDTLVAYVKWVADRDWEEMTLQ